MHTKKYLLHKIIITVISFILLFSLTSCNSTFVICDGNDLNLDEYELVFCDDFDGNTLDVSVWEYRNVGPLKRHGETLDEIKQTDHFNHPDQVYVNNGCLVIEGAYTTKEYGEGWHTASIRLKDFYTYGYFEIKCIPNDSEYFWSAFWLQSDNSYSHEISKGGIYGAELDIFETYKGHGVSTKNYIASSIHCNGFDEFENKVDSQRVVKAYVKDLRSEYTTFGLMWTEEEYIFYINGVETGRTSFACGTSCVPEEVIISLCVPNEIDLDKNTTTRFIVDYVKIYQIRK